MNIDPIKAKPVLKTASRPYKLVQFGVDKRACLVSYTIEDPTGGCIHGSSTQCSETLRAQLQKRIRRLNHGRVTTDAIERGRRRAVQLTKKRIKD